MLPARSLSEEEAWLYFYFRFLSSYPKQIASMNWRGWGRGENESRELPDCKQKTCVSSALSQHECVWNLMLESVQTVRRPRLDPVLAPRGQRCWPHFSPAPEVWGVSSGRQKVGEGYVVTPHMRGGGSWEASPNLYVPNLYPEE